MTSVVTNFSLINKVYIPKYIFPVAKCLFVGINFLLTLIPWFAAIVRRLHDIGRNGWWAICPIIPWIFICKDSDKETNEYGRSPKYDTNYVVEELPDRGTQNAMWCLIAVVIAFILLFFVFAGAIGGAVALSNGY